MQIVEKSCRLLYLYTANVTELQHTIFFLTLVYKKLLEMSLSLHFSTEFNIMSESCLNESISESQNWIVLDL